MSYSEIAAAIAEAAHEGYCEGLSFSVNFNWFLTEEFPGYDAYKDYEAVMELARKEA